MLLAETVQEMKRAARDLYGPRGWQRALHFAVRAVQEYEGRDCGLVIYAEDGETMDARYRAVKDYAEHGDAFNMLDPMIAYGWTYTDKDGNTWTGKPQKVQACEDEGGQDD